MSTAFLQSIPEVTMSPTSGGSSRPTTEMSETPGRSGGGFGRRTFLRTAMAGAATLAFTGLGWIGGGPAYAVTRRSRHPSHCMNTNVSGDTPCWGRQYISGRFCASDGYHRTDSKNFGSYTEDYNWEAACGGYAGWYWRKSNGTVVHCWDGYFYAITNATGHRTRHTTSCKK